MENIQKRLGKVKISTKLLNKFGIDELKLLFSDIYPVSIDITEYGEQLIYYCLSPLFDVKLDEAAIPEYELTFIQTLDEEVKLKATKL